MIPGADFYDKEALAAGKNQNKNDVYVTLTNFLGQPFIGPPPGCGTQLQFGFGQIEVWRSHDAGATWQGPAIAGPERPDSVASCGNEGTLQQSSAPAVGPNGELYVVWQLGPTFLPDGNTTADADIAFAKSTDGGVTFSAPTKVADINSSRANPPLGYNRGRINDHPRIEVATTGKHKGRIYVTYYSSTSPVPSATNPATAQTLVNIQTFLKYSDNGGATWSAPVEIGGALPATSPGSTALERSAPSSGTGRTSASAPVARCTSCTWRSRRPSCRRSGRHECSAHVPGAPPSPASGRSARSSTPGGRSRKTEGRASRCR